MLSIRLQRRGRKHQPSYRVVVAERRSKLNAPAVEDLGFWNPIAKEVNLNKERLLYWLRVGAQATATVHNLLVRQGILRAPKIEIKVKSKRTVEANSASVATEANLPANSGENSQSATADKD